MSETHELWWEDETNFSVLCLVWTKPGWATGYCRDYLLIGFD